jgi:3-hydroxyacyl-[acyl-carrier-protein] dehydratase
MTLTAPAGRAEIEAAIPHRDPFLLVDEVSALDDTSIATAWTVPTGAFWERGHYPGQPVTPGVLLVEHVLQSGALYVSRRLEGFSADDGVPVLTKLEQARFRQMVLPGERVETEVQLVEQVGPAWFLAGTVKKDGKKVLQVRFALSATAAMSRVDA